MGADEGHRGGSGLHGRQRELGLIEAVVGAALAGEGEALLFEGAAGIGKSSLLAAAAERARVCGACVLSARGARLEREYPWGVAIELFDGAVAADRETLLSGPAGPAAALFGATPGSAGPSADPFPIIHGLYWLLMNAVDRGPVLLVVDDLQWCDGPTLELLAYLIPRLDGVGASIVLAFSGGEAVAAEADRTLGRLDPRGPLRRHRLAPLSRQAVGALVEERFPGAEKGFTDAAMAATGGNPFLCEELLRAAQAAGLAADADGGSRLAELRPPVLGESIAARIDALGLPAAGLAAAIAVLGGGAELTLVARLAGLDEQAAVAAADALASAEIVRVEPRLGFVHTLVGEAIHDALEPARRSRLHIAAARLLWEAGADPERVARHIREGGPAGEEWARPALARAASQALSRGAPAHAADLLRRALEEPGKRDDAAILIELGRAEVALGDPAALGRLEAAAKAAPDAVGEAAALAALSFGRYVAGDPVGACAASESGLERIRTGAGGPLEADLLFSGYLAGRADPRLAAGATSMLAASRVGLAGESTPAELVRRVLLAWEGLLAGELGDGEDVRAIYEVLDATPDAGVPWFALGLFSIVLSCSGRYREAGQLIERYLERARRLGRRLEVAMMLEQRSHLRFLLGQLGGTLADSESVLELSEGRWDQATIPTRAILASALIERDEDEQATATLAVSAELERRLPGTWANVWLPYGRARIAYAAGDWAGAAEQALSCGARLLAIDVPSPDYCEWRSLAARGLVRAGEAERARELAREELELAEGGGSPRARGIARATLGSLLPGVAGPDTLGEAISELDRHGAALEAVRARVDLGVSLRRLSRPRQARESLAEARERAGAIGARRLERTAFEELRAAGGRPRRIALSGVESLTPAQRRVAELAAEGRSNREIAATLFVTVRTVESHLTAAYRKLGVDSRAGLGAALGTGVGT